MNNLRMTVKDDSGEECPIENIEPSRNTFNSSTKKE